MILDSKLLALFIDTKIHSLSWLQQYNLTYYRFTWIIVSSSLSKRDVASSVGLSSLEEYRYVISSDAFKSLDASSRIFKGENVNYYQSNTVFPIILLITLGVAFFDHLPGWGSFRGSGFFPLKIGPNGDFFEGGFELEVIRNKFFCFWLILP
jgi:hypothetical protein